MINKIFEKFMQEDEELRNDSKYESERHFLREFRELLESSIKARIKELEKNLITEKRVGSDGEIGFLKGRIRELRELIQ